MTSKKDIELKIKSLEKEERFNLTRRCTVDPKSTKAHYLEREIDIINTKIKTLQWVLSDKPMIL